jgi:hypothetical protein
MDNFLRALIVTLLFSFDASASWTKITVDGVATGQYMRTDQYTSLQAQLGRVSGGYQNKLQTSAPNTAGGSYISPVTTSATIPKIGSNVKIPVSSAAGAFVTAVLAAPVLKSAIAKAALVAVRLNPYVGTAVTLGWLANAGYQYLSESQTFSTLPTAQTSTLPGGCTGGYPDPVAMCQHFEFSSNPLNFIVAASGALQFKCLKSNGQISSQYQCLSTYNAQCASPKYWDSVYKQCITPAGVVQPVTDQQAETALASKPISGSVDTPQTINDELGELIKLDTIPELDTASGQELTGPNGETEIVTPGGTETTTTPDGNVTQRRLEYKTRFADDRAEIMEMIEETVTPASGSPTTTTTTKPADIDQAIASSQVPPEPPKTDCQLFPDAIGCSKYGDIPTQELIPVVQIPASMDYTSWGEGSCPAPVTTVHGIVFDYQPMCDKLVIIKPILLSCGLILSMFILIGAVKE